MTVADLIAKLLTVPQDYVVTVMTMVEYNTFTAPVSDIAIYPKDAEVHLE